MRRATDPVTIVSTKRPIKTCLTYVSVPHLGFGWVQGCISIIEYFSAASVRPILFLPKSFKTISPTVAVRESLPAFLPYRYFSGTAHRLLDCQFRHALKQANPRDTIVYFWPSPPQELIRYATARGFLTVGEMINNCSETSKRILDEAYDRLGLQPPDQRRITEKRIENQRKELRLYDYIMSCNPHIDKSLLENGIDRAKIIRSSFGWSPDKLALSNRDEGRKGFRALFIGGDTVRKGLPQLLAAWKKSHVSGELLIVGAIEPSLKAHLGSLLSGSDIRLLDFVTDLGRLYKSADVFVFPSLEEGDPQVTYEAAGSGLPIITTPMGAAQIIKNDVNGLIVHPYDVDGLAEAIFRLAHFPDLRRRLGNKAADDALSFTYEKVGLQRAALLTRLLAAHFTDAKTEEGAPLGEERRHSHDF